MNSTFVYNSTKNNETTNIIDSYFAPKYIDKCPITKCELKKKGCLLEYKTDAEKVQDLADEKEHGHDPTVNITLNMNAAETKFNITTYVNKSDGFNETICIVCYNKDMNV